MAGKSHRVAARQSQLNRRRKKQNRGPSGIPTAPARPQGAEAAAGETGSSTAAVATAATPPAAPERATGAVPAAASSPRPTNGRGRSPAAMRDHSVPAAQYMAPEIRRILTMAGVGFAVLIVLKFVL